MKKQNSGYIIFLVGGIGLAGLIVFFVFVRQLFMDTFPNAVQNTAEVIPSAELDFDPLVTVVPPEERFPAIPKALETDPQRGVSNPTVTIIEFGDFECEGCATMKPIIEQVLEEYPDDVLHVWKDYPLPSIHPYAETAAIAARCAQAQDTFWAYHDLLLDRYNTLILQPWAELATAVELNEEQFNTCLSDGSMTQRVTEGFLIARSLELDSTPTYFVNDQKLTGAQTIEELRAAIEKELTTE